jgi:nucleotide-binding universal stress UspA family protein
VTHVVVPLDGSSRSETAVPHAVRAAAGGPLTLVTTMWGDDAEAPREYLEGQARELADLEVTTTVVRERAAADAILLVADAHAGSIVCMATHGRSGLGEAMLGSVAESVVRGAHGPVLLVGPHVEDDGARLESARLVVAVDHPPTAAAITPAAAELASRLGLAISVLEVVAPPPIPFAAEDDTLAWPGEGAGAEAAVAALAPLGFRAETRIVRDVNPAAAIAGVARDLSASAIVVGTHARRGLARVALGSVAMDVVHRSPCPVLVVRV